MDIIQSIHATETASKFELHDKTKDIVSEKFCKQYDEWSRKTFGEYQKPCGYRVEYFDTITGEKKSKLIVHPDILHEFKQQHEWRADLPWTSSNLYSRGLLGVDLD